MKKIIIKGQLQLISVSLFYLLAYLAWNTLSGKDLNWDSLNYHYGLAHIYFTGTFNDHFFPVNIQSGLNPVGYFPFYYMVSQNWHSLLIAGSFASFQSLNSILAFLISRTLFKPFTSNFIFLFLVSCLSTIGMVQLQMIGSSFIDLSVTVFFLLALHLLISLKNKELGVKFFLIGFLLGAASILKLPYSVFAVSGIIFVVTKERNIISSLYYISGGALGALSFGGHWHFLTWQKYQNPFFPFFNNIFESTFFPHEKMQHLKFTPESISDFVLQPFEFALPYAQTYIESIAPDARFLIFFLILPLFLFVLYVKKKKSARYDVIIFFIVSYCLWALSSANARYGLVLFYLVGILIPYLLVQTIGFKYSRIAVLILIILQITISIVSQSHLSWTSQAWTNTWYGYGDLKKFSTQEKPALYLTSQLLTASFILNLVPEKSSLMSIAGQWSLPINRDNNYYLNKLSNKNEFNIKAVYLLGKPDKEMSLSKIDHDAMLLKNLISLSYAHKTWGFNIDYKSCNQFGENDSGDYYLYICDVTKQRESKYGYKQAHFHFAQLESICEKLRPTQGSPIATERGGWKKYYFNDDILITIAKDGKIYGKQSREISPYYIGNISQFMLPTNNYDKLSVNCSSFGKRKIKAY